MILVLALLIGAGLTAGHWLPGIAPRVAARWDMGLTIGSMDLFPLHRAEMRGVKVYPSPAAAARNEAPAVTIDEIAVTYASVGELIAGHIGNVRVQGVTVHESPARTLAAKLSALAPPPAAPDWSQLQDMLRHYLPDNIKVVDAALIRPDGQRYAITEARLAKSTADGGDVRLSLKAATPPLHGMIPFQIPDPLLAESIIDVSAKGLSVEKFTLDIGPLLRAEGRTIEPFSAPEKIALRVTSLDWDWAAAHRAIGLEPAGDLRFKPLDLTLRASLGGAPPTWAADFPQDSLVAEFLFPASPVAWSDITQGQSVEGQLAANAQAVFDPATGRLRAALLTRTVVKNLILPGRRFHDLSAMLIGTADANLARRDAAWDVTIQAAAPLDAVPMLKDWRAALDGKTSGRAAVAPMRAAVEYDISTTMTRRDGEELRLPISGAAEWGRNEGATTSSLSASVRTMFDGAVLAAAASATIATTPSLTLRAEWVNLDLARAAERASLFTPLPDGAVTGVTSGTLIFALPADSLAETSATIHLRDAAAEWPRGTPFLAAPVSFHAAFDGRGFPWQAAQGALYNLHVGDDQNFDVTLSDLTPLRDDFTAWRVSAASRLADFAWLTALTSQTLPLDIRGAVEQSGDARVALNGDAIAFQYDGRAALSEFSIVPREPEPLFQVEYLTTALDLSTSGMLSPAAMDVGFRIVPAEVDINRLTAPHLDWAFFEAEIAASGRAHAALGNADTMTSLTLHLPEYSFALPGMMTVSGALRGGAELGEAGFANPWGETEFSAEVTDATSLGWQLGVWQGDGDIRARLAPARATLAGDRATLEGRLELDSPHGEAPYAYVLWSNMRAAGDIKAATNLALTEYTLQSNGRAELDEATGGGATATKMAARWKIDLPHARLTLDAGQLYGANAWATLTVDDFPAAPHLRAQGEVLALDLENFTTNYKTGDIAMQGRMDVDWAASWDFHNPAAYRARLRSADDVITVDKDSVKWLLDQAFGGAANPLGFLSPARTLDRNYKPGGKNVIMHRGRVMIPFTQFEAMSRFQRGSFRNQIILENKYFSIDFQPNVQAPVVLEFLELAQSNMNR